MSSGELRVIGIDGIPEVQAGDDLAAMIGDAIASGPGLEAGDVIVVTHKIVSKAEGQVVDLREIEPSALARQIGQRWDKDPRKTEVVLREQCVDSVIVGIGLNVNLRPSDVPRPLLVDATSLSQVVGRRVSRWQLLGEVLSSVRKRYLALGRGVSPLAEWAEGLAYIGELVSVCEAGVFFEGIAEAVDADGALRIVQADGRRRRVLAGDVTVRLAKEI